MMSLPEWRLRLVEKYMAQLSSDDAAKRRDAARWLGEAIEDPAIPRLIDLYQNDPDARVRKAAAYALGQFRAFDIALKEDEEFAGEIIDDVIVKGQLGRPAPTGGLKAALIGLTLSLLVLVGLAIAAPPGLLGEALAGLDVAALIPGGSAAAVPTLEPTVVGFQARPDLGDPRRAALLTDLRGTFVRVRDDTGNLQAQLQNALSGSPLDCAAFFNNPPPYVLSDENAARYPDLAVFVERLTTAQLAYQTTFARYDAACFGTEPLSREGVGPVLATLRPAIEEVAALGPDLEAMEGVGLPTPTTPPLIAPGAAGAAATLDSAAPTPEPSPTPDLTRALATAFNTLDQVLAQRGAASLLVTYWDDFVRVGQTAGCNPPFPVIPENVELDPALGENALLTQGVTLLNQALEDSRIGWQTFQIACTTTDANALARDAARGVENARAIRASFEAALEILEGLR